MTHPPEQTHPALNPGPAPSPSPEPRGQRRRWKRWLLGCISGCSVVLILAAVLISLSALAYRRANPVPPSDPDKLLVHVSEEVEGLHDLDFERDVEMQFISSDELRQKMSDALDESPEDEIDRIAHTLVALGLVDEDTDLESILVDSGSDMLSGYYIPEDGVMYLVSENELIDPSERVTLAHELTHALQDQHFDLSRLEDPSLDSEAASAYRAFIEGEASYIDALYQEAHLAPDEHLRKLLIDLQMDLSFMEDIPMPLLLGQAFPYIQGRAFFEDIYEFGGWPAVARTHEDPPVSTEQILHPVRYLRGDMPMLVTIPPLTDTLGAGWQQMDSEIMGEFSLRTQMATRIPEALAINAAEGWGGDRFVVFHNESRASYVLVMDSLWDSAFDAVEFFEGYSQYLAEVYESEAVVDEAGRRCWTSDRHQCLWLEENRRVLTLRAPSATEVNALVRRINR